MTKASKAVGLVAVPLLFSAIDIVGASAENKASDPVITRESAKGAIKFPSEISGIRLGRDSEEVIVRALGKPQERKEIRIEETKEDVTDLEYPEKGIEFTILHDKLNKVCRVRVFAPYPGTTSTGVKVGMPIEEARALMAKQYGAPKTEWEGYVAWKMRNSFWLSHADGRVTAITILGSDPKLNQQRADNLDNERAEQDGADQPATVPESKPEGKEKPEPASEGHPPVVGGRPSTFAEPTALLASKPNQQNPLSCLPIS